MKNMQSKEKHQEDNDYKSKDEVLIEDLIRVIYKGRYLLLLSLIISIAMTFYYINSRPVVYKSSMRFLQNNISVSEYNKSIMTIFGSDEFNQELAKDENLKKRYAEFSNKPVSQVSETDVLGWISGSSIDVKPEEQEKSIVNGQYVPRITSFTVTASGGNKELNAILANTYFDALNRILERNQAKYNSDKIKFLQKKVDVLREELVRDQQSNNRLQQSSSVTAYETALSELAEAKSSDLNYRTIITQVSKASVPGGPEAINKKKYMVMGFGMGIFVGLLLCFIYDFIKNINWKSIRN
jgi:uncharacterized protein involved in exopolysaccharide biosynthesis